MKRFLLIAAVLGLIALALKGRAKQREAWHGISEAEARDRLEQRLPSRIPEEKRDAVKEKIVGRMRERGIFEEADGAEEAEDAEDAGQADEADTAEIDLREQPAEAAEAAVTTTT